MSKKSNDPFLQTLYDCGKIFCQTDRTAAVQLKVKRKTTGYTTVWLCPTHAIEVLRREQQNSEAVVNEYRQQARL